MPSWSEEGGDRLLAPCPRPAILRPVAPSAPPGPAPWGVGLEGCVQGQLPSLLPECGPRSPPSPGCSPSCWTIRACVPRGPPSPQRALPSPGLPGSSTSTPALPVSWGDPLCLGASTWDPILLPSEGPGTLSVSKAPPPQPPPPAFISMQAQAAQTQGDCSSRMLRAGGWEQAAHTPRQAQATGRLALPHPVSPDKLCPPSLRPSPPRSSLHHHGMAHRLLGEEIGATQGDPELPPALPVASPAASHTSPFLSGPQVPLVRPVPLGWVQPGGVRPTPHPAVLPAPPAPGETHLGSPEVSKPRQIP